ncbi:hypothetical protein SAMN05216480_10467 [Pustulibacterium marinum]|uniref:Lipoprotein n=1 Tax=Pustulibacterium marinum TaxID=1224947 RepID=A0A1I7GBH6_9FLAO|nr:hypothetical protein [Pustulibacterium marinum]SFU45790.1 hypothetical protein SAMN05216480_10467 [Pustulibacterium marinum]
MKIKITLLLFLTVLFSCKTDPNQQIDEGKITENTYHNEEIGWTMEIPEGWNVTHKSDVDRRTKKGLEALSETSGFEIDTSGLKQLLNFEKNRFNIFQSTSELFEVEYEGEWEETNASAKELIYYAYMERGIRADSTAIKTIVIDGMEFQLYGFTIYNAKGEVLLNQLIYSRLINGYSFGVSIHYNNEADKKQMLDAWLNSTFQK